jgi:hypothetical protein
MLRAGAKLVALLVVIESIFASYGYLTMARGNPFLLYSPSRLAAQIETNLPIERTAPPTGWLNNGEMLRPHPLVAGSRCGSTWGGSFTFSDDVADGDAWPYLLSQSLGCEIANYGVHGFAVDQTLMLFEQQHPQNEIVILGLAPPMILANGVGSWTFLDPASDHSPEARVTKPYYSLRGNDLDLTPRPVPDVVSIEQHYRHDLYRSDWTPLQFPFAYHVMGAIFRKYRKQRQTDFSAMDSAPEITELRHLTIRLVAEMAAKATINHDRFAVLLIPKPEDSLDPNPVSSAMLREIKKTTPSVCTIDPSDALRHAAQADAAPMMTPSKHFNPAGLRVLAGAVGDGLSACGIEP